ncbi:EVE domain-containing protein [Candidatus Nomurabacteria bacterium]|nr:EVE domain-containing protein [Candidatus Nomurabacteria bacterium]
MQYWLMKTEPSEFSIDDLAKKKLEMWDGVRNYQVRNMMRDDIKIGDLVFIYHSNAGADTGIVGVVKIAKEAYPDPTQFDPKSAHPDPKSDPANPNWLCVDVEFVKKFKRIVTLHELKADLSLTDFRLVKRGNRLSVMPVTKKEFEYISKLALS